MAEKIIGSLIYGQHTAPKRGLPWQVKLTRAIAVVVAVSVVFFLVWKFINYREEHQVTLFLDEVTHSQFDQAFQTWDAGGSYKMSDFVDDWGPNGYYLQGTHNPYVKTSKGAGQSVIVCVSADKNGKLIPIRVDKESLKLSFNPTDQRGRNGCN